MWNKFKNWHKTTWNDGNIGKAKIIGGWFVLLMIISSMDESSTNTKHSSSNKIEKLKQECESLALKYADSELLLKKHVDEFNIKTYGVKSILIENGFFTDVHEYLGKYYAKVFIHGTEIDVTLNNDTLIKKAERSSHEAKSRLHDYFKYYPDNTSMVDTNQSNLRGLYKVTLSGRAGYSTCELDKNLKTHFHKFELLKQDNIRKTKAGFNVRDGFKPAKVLKITELNNE